MLTEADAALEAVEFARAKPGGTIKASCPVALAQSPWRGSCPIPGEVPRRAPAAARE